MIERIEDGLINLINKRKVVKSIKGKSINIRRQFALKADQALRDPINYLPPHHQRGSIESVCRLIQLAYQRYHSSLYSSLSL